MGISKTEYYTNKQNEMATLIKALAHPARVAIIEFLLKHNSCICGDIVNELPLAQPTISQHLKELKTAGIIKGNIEGNAICYCVDEKVWQKIEAWFAGISKKLERRKSNCC